MLHARSVVRIDFHLPDTEAETEKHKQTIELHEYAPGGVSPTNMPVAKRLYFAIPGTKRIMQEGALGETRGVAIFFAKACFARCLVNYYTDSSKTIRFFVFGILFLFGIFVLDPWGCTSGFGHLGVDS